jgi:hypothetical protein
LHVIDRGKYRPYVPAGRKATGAFEGSLFQACEKAGWALHAHVVMRNHEQEQTHAVRLTSGQNARHEISFYRERGFASGRSGG